MRPYYDHAGIVIYHGDCREILRNLIGEAEAGDWIRDTVQVIVTSAELAALKEILARLETCR